jgi:hypothetical protein
VTGMGVEFEEHAVLDLGGVDQFALEHRISPKNKAARIAPGGRCSCLK